jgi:hypothetical protein
METKNEEISHFGLPASLEFPFGHPGASAFEVFDLETANMANIGNDETVFARETTSHRSCHRSILFRAIWTSPSATLFRPRFRATVLVFFDAIGLCL